MIYKPINFQNVKDKGVLHWHTRYHSNLESLLLLAYSFRPYPAWWFFQLIQPKFYSIKMSEAWRKRRAVYQKENNSEICCDFWIHKKVCVFFLYYLYIVYFLVTRPSREQWWAPAAAAREHACVPRGAAGGRPHCGGGRPPHMPRHGWRGAARSRPRHWNAWYDVLIYST